MHYLGLYSYAMLYKQRIELCPRTLIDDPKHILQRLPQELELLDNALHCHGIRKV